MAETVREIVAVFENPDDIERAVFDLETHGFDRAAISLLATEQAVKEKLGREYHRIEEMEDEPKAPRETFFTRVSRIEAEVGVVAALASFGALAAAGTGAAIVTLPMLIAAGTGAAIGGVLSGLMHRHHAQRVSEQLARGGLLLWVAVRDAKQEEIALKLLLGYATHDVHVHEFPA